MAYYPGMKTRAAIAFEPLKPLQIEHVTLQPPKAGEILIRMHTASICHWDLMAWRGQVATTRFPAILGHEGAGIVEAIGPEVKNFMVGDPVIPLFLPECGVCRICTHTEGNLCEALAQTYGLGFMPDGTTRFQWNDQVIYHGFGPATLAEHTVVPEICAVRLPAQLDLEAACFLGCTLPTGVGAVLNKAQVKPGSTVAVFHLGGTGLSVIQGAVLAQAERIIGIDTDINRFALAQSLGATECLNPLDFSDDIATVLRDKTQGGVAYAFECGGDPAAMQIALESCHPAMGLAVLVRTAPEGETLTLSPGSFLTGRGMTGARFGSLRGRSHLPHYADLLLHQHLQAQPLITHRLPLQDINLAFDLLHAGSSIRTSIQFE